MDRPPSDREPIFYRFTRPIRRYRPPDHRREFMPFTRRRLLVTAGAPAAASALPPARTALAAPEAPPLPPPLKSEVFKERQAKLRAEAKAHGLDVLFATPSTNL